MNNINVELQHLKNNRSLILLFFLIASSCYSQRNFFLTDKVIMKCDSFVMHFDEESELNIATQFYWKVCNDRFYFNKKVYYPFIFNKNNPTDTLGFIRFENDKVLIITDSDKKEQILFSFSNTPRKWTLHGIYGFNSDFYYIRSYYDAKYKERIHVIKSMGEAGRISFKEIHIGIKTGVVKVIFYTPYGSEVLNCILNLN